MVLIEMLKEIITDTRGGPTPYFDVVHIVMAIRLIGEHLGIGRKELSKRLGIGEGSVRTLLNKLKGSEIISITKEGCKLSDKGLKIYNWLLEMIPTINEVDLKEIWGHQFSVGVIIRNSEHLIKKGIEQRDAAVKFGAAGAITLIFKSGRLLMPEIADLSIEYPDFAAKLMSKFLLNEGDVLILVGADNFNYAYYGALAAALATIGMTI